MSDGYTKLFSDIIDSSIWDEDSDTCKVWVTLLALSNADGFVRGSVGWLAGKARVTIEKCTAALKRFREPDHHSRTPDNEGRRIENLEDGWLILNYLIFRDRLSSNPKAIKTRERVRKHREKHQERYQALRNAESVTSVTANHSASASESVSDKSYSPACRSVLFILNEATGRRFRETEANLSVIEARLREPEVTIDGVRLMIARQVKRWKGTTQEEYLRPQTLFSLSKFDSYYAARELPVQIDHENHNRSDNRSNDRNQGTYNEGTAHLYANAAIKAGKVPDPRRPGPGANGG